MSERQPTTEGAVKRIAQRAGVQSITGLVTEECGRILKRFLDDVMKRTIIHVTHEKMTTVQVKHVEQALPVAMFSDVIERKFCGVTDLKTAKAKTRAYQRCPNLLMQALPFERVVRDIGKDYATVQLRYSEDALTVLQYAAEHYLVSLFQNAKLIATAAGRMRVDAKDLNTTLLIRGSDSDPHMPTAYQQSFDIYIKRVLKVVRDGKVPPMTISTDATSQISFIINQLVKKIVCSARSMGDVTLSSRCIQSAVQEVLTPTLAEHAISEGTKVTTRFTQQNSVAKGPQERAGLTFSIARIEHLIRNGCKSRVGEAACVYLTAVAEYFAVELLDLAGVVAREHKASRITARHLLIAIDKDDEELKTMKKRLGLDVLAGGVLPPTKTF